MADLLHSLQNSYKRDCCHEKFLFSSAILATIALFTACGDDVTEVNEIHQDGIAMLDAGLELSKQKCNSANAGEMLYVTDSAMVFMCDGGIWVSLKGADGENGNDGESCMAKPVKNEAGVEGLEVTCGKTVVGTIWNGVDGNDGDDGESCTAKPVKNEAGVEGLEVTCGKTVVGTIWSGKDGVDGKPGEDGDDGDDGESCTAKPVKNEAGVEGLEVTCGKTVVGTIWNGENGNDGERCMAKPVKNEAGVEGLEVTCGKTVVGTIWNGTNGEDGDDGESCEISREGNVLTITCGKSIETIDLDKLIQTSSSEEEPSSSEESSSSEEESSSSSSSVIASSSSAKQSSSSEESSSSEAVTEVMPSGTYDCDVYKCVSTEHLNRDMLDTNGYGEILDTRDDQVYKVVTIGGQVWMAQNLNYENDGICYGGASGNCAKYGRLYIWYEARNACPVGWHLPNKKDWEDLFENVGGSGVAGSKLKSKNGWNGEDSYGFAVLPAGYRDDYGSFNLVGYEAVFWSSTEEKDGAAYREAFFDGDSGVDEKYFGKTFAFSVRCLKD